MLKLTKDEVRWIGSLGASRILALGTNGCSRARSNAQIASDVQNRIRTDARMQMARVRVLATGGVVTLSGYVTSDDQRAATVQDASQVKDVRLVIDDLRVLDSRPMNSGRSPSFRSRSPLRKTVGWGHSRRRGKVERPASPRPIVLKSDFPLLSDHTSAPEHLPVARRSRSVRRQSLQPLRSLLLFPATPERHAIGSTVPDTGGSMAPVSASTNATPARPVPPVPAERIDVPNGTELVVRLTESLSSEVNEKGDTFLASLASPIVIGDRVVIPADAGVEGRVVDVENAGRFSGRPRLAVQMTRLTYNGNIYDLRSSQYSRQGASRDVRSIAAIGGGAGVGAIIGGILGGGRGAAIGSMIGAGAGTGAQATSKAPQVKLPAETVLSVRLPKSSQRHTFGDPAKSAE